MKKNRFIKCLLMVVILIGIGVSGVLAVHGKHTADAQKDAEILLCKEETKWYYRIENGVLQRRQWSLTYGKWMTEWMEVAGTKPVPDTETKKDEQIAVTSPIQETGNRPEDKGSILTKTKRELCTEVFQSLSLNPSEWFCEILHKTSNEAFLLLYPPRVQVSPNDTCAELRMNTKDFIYLVSVKQKGEELLLTPVKEYGVSQVGVFPSEQESFVGIVYLERFSGWEEYGMKWYSFNGEGACSRICNTFERDSLYSYWKNRKPVLSPNGTLDIYARYQQDGAFDILVQEPGLKGFEPYTEYVAPYLWKQETTVTVTAWLKDSVPYDASFGVTGPELIRMVMEKEEEKVDLHFSVGYNGAAVMHYFTKDEATYFAIKKYGSSHQAGFQSVVIGTLDESGELYQCDLYGGDRAQTTLHYGEENEYGKIEPNYLALLTEREFQGLITEEKRVFRTNGKEFLQTSLSTENKISEGSEVIWTDEKVLEEALTEAYRLIEQKNYPMAMSVLMKNNNAPQARELLEKLDI